MPGVRRRNAYTTSPSVSNKSSIIDPTRLILKSSLAGKCADTPGELLVVENQSVLAGCSLAFEQQFQQHSASTEVFALRCKPADRDIASAHNVQAVMSYCSGLYQDCPAGYPGSPALYWLAPLRFQTNRLIGLPYLEGRVPGALQCGATILLSSYSMG